MGKLNDAIMAFDREMKWPIRLSLAGDAESPAWQKVLPQAIHSPAYQNNPFTRRGLAAGMALDISYMTDEGQIQVFTDLRRLSMDDAKIKAFTARLKNELRTYGISADYLDEEAARRLSPGAASGASLRAASIAAQRIIPKGKLVAAHM